MLARHHSDLGNRRLDEAFARGARRTTEFHTVRNYIRSHAAERYHAIARHDYQETGKTWPPSYVDGPPLDDEAERWRKFIDDYPQFPGVDDAYYRLAFSLYAAYEYEAAVAIAMEFLDADLTDDDARPYILHLLRDLALVYPNSGVSFTAMRHLRALSRQPLGPAIFLPNPDLQLQVEAIDWFLEDPERMRFINATRKDLVATRRICTTIAYGTRDTRMDAVCRILEADDMGSALAVLFGVFVDPAAPPTSAGEGRRSMSLQVADRAMRAVARRLKGGLSGPSVGTATGWGVVDHARLALAIDSDWRFYRYQPVFSEVYDALATLDTELLPEHLHRQHGYFVRRMTR